VVFTPLGGRSGRRRSVGLIYRKAAAVSDERNIALARRYYAECTPDDGDPEKKRAQQVVDEILGADFTMYFNSEADDEAMHGPDEHKDFLVRHTRSFGGERWSVEAIVADEDTVACQWRIRATHTETGNPIDLQAADFFTVRDGRLAVLRRFLDFETLEAQMSPDPAEQPAAS
jgi:ketosteroid isomerase-like protein